MNHSVTIWRKSTLKSIQSSSFTDLLLSSRTSIETDLRVEKEFRQRLQQALSTEKEKVSTLQFDMHELNLVKQVNHSQDSPLPHPLFRLGI